MPESAASYEDAFDSLHDVYLEDSWVLGVGRDGDRVCFDIEAVLTTDHPRYSAPRAGEQYCYKRGELCVSGVVTFAPSNAPAAVDASGSEDLGNIDSFRLRNDGVWVAAGEWGVLEARDPEVTLAFAL